MEKTAVSRQAGETCLICEKERDVGIHICDQFICETCEQKLVQTDTADTDYGYYLRKLRNLCGSHMVEKM